MPTGGNLYGNGVPIVVRDRESLLHGEGVQVSELIAKRVFFVTLKLKVLTGEPDAVKVARPVRRGAVLNNIYN